MFAQKTLIAAAATSALAVGLTASAAPIAVANASFEDAPIAQDAAVNSVGQINGAISGWESFGSTFRFGPELDNATFYNTQDVLVLSGQGVMVGGTQQGIGNGAGGSGLYQDLGATYIEGMEYTFTLQVGGGYESAGGNQTIGFATTATDLSGTLLASSNVAFPANGPNWVENSVSFTATAAEAGQTIRIILGTTDANGTQTFDLAAVDAVPEPGSLALLGLGGLAMLRRRRPVTH